MELEKLLTQKIKVNRSYMLAVMAQRQSNRSFKSLFVARSFVVADAVDFCHRRGGAGGVNSPPVDASSNHLNSPLCIPAGISIAAPARIPGRK